MHGAAGAAALVSPAEIWYAVKLSDSYAMKRLSSVLGGAVICVVLVLGTVALLLLVPGRSAFVPHSLAEFWARAIWRISSYQQLLAGLLALYAALSVIGGALIQRSAQQQVLHEQTVREQIGIASALVAEITAIIRACDEFDAKFQANISRLKAANQPMVGRLQLPFTSEVYKALVPDLGKLPLKLQIDVVTLYAAYEVYLPHMIKDFAIPPDRLDDEFEQLNKWISGELRDRCRTTVANLEAFLSENEQALASG